jgi:nucleotide-binding universal stress UspA family protein
MKTILVPVDLSAAGPRACDAACDLARLMQARLVLLHVVQPPAVMMVEIYALGAGQAEEMLAAAEDAGTDRLRTLAARCAKRGVEVETVHRVGLPVVEILSRAKKADYIVMGSHGHGAMYDLLVGSTAHGVLKKAPCPVVVVPQKRGSA